MDVNYRDWIGRNEQAEERLSLSPARRLAATLDDTDASFADGDPLPPLWHWLYFLPNAPQSKLSSDGHPERGDFLPPVSLPRRMFAGGQIDFHHPLPIGAPAFREGEVMDITEKEGRSGKLVFAKVRYRIHADNVLCIEEHQDIVYRDMGPPVPEPQPMKTWPKPADGAWMQEIEPDPVLLFRFSALTFNAHRIHYDRPYAANTEGYPGLVVHGPLIAMLLMELVRKNATQPIKHFSFRATAPIFDTAPFHTIGTLKDNTAELTALRCDGETAMSATAEFA